MDINKCCFTGRLTHRPKISATKTDKMVAEFSLAVNDGWGDNTKVYYLDFVAWENNAKYLQAYAQKGMAVTLEAKCVQQRWEKDDETHQKVCFVAETIRLHFKGDKPEADHKDNSDLPNAKIIEEE